VLEEGFFFQLQAIRQLKYKKAVGKDNYFMISLLTPNHSATDQGTFLLNTLFDKRQ